MAEVFRNIMFGLLALTIPLAAYIAYLDFQEWHRTRTLLGLARGMTRVGWILSLSAIAVRWSYHLPPIEHSFLGPVFFVGMGISCAGYFGVALNYHAERKRGGET